MAMDLQREPDLYNRGDKRPVFAGDLESATVKAGTEVTVFQKQVPDDKIAWFGHGSHQRSVAEAFIFADLDASGNGTGTAGDPIEGELVAAVLDSEQRRVLASTTIDSLGELADAKADERTERPVMEALAPYAKPGRYLEFRVRSASSSDGYEIDTSGSSARLYYTFA